MKSTKLTYRQIKNLNKKCFGVAHYIDLEEDNLNFTNSELKKICNAWEFKTNQVLNKITKKDSWEFENSAKDFKAITKFYRELTR